MRILLAVVTALALVSPAFAQMSKSDFEDDMKRLDIRHLTAVDRAMQNRDFFAAIHDSIYHPEYKAVKAARAKYEKLRGELRKSVDAGETRKGMTQLEQLMNVGEELDEATQRYTNSSSNAVEKIQIGLGVFAFLIAGLVYWLVKLRKKK